MKLKYSLPVLLITLIPFLALGCQSSGSLSTGKKSIVVTYSILGSLVKDLVGDQADVTVIIPNGADLHEFEPSARDIEKLNQADLVIENGLELESQMLRSLKAARNRGIKFFTASDHFSVRHVGAGEGIGPNDPDQALGAPDPHSWMDPLMMKEVMTALSPFLQQELGLNVSAQSADLEKRLANLDTEIAGIVAQIPPSDRKLVTGHESMGYFARRYGFKLVGVIIPSLSSQAQVSAAELTDLARAIRENQVKTIFTELGTSPAVAKAIGDATGVRVVELTTHALPADGSYFSFMRETANLISNTLK